MPNGRLATFFYAYPPGVNSSPMPLFQAYLGYMKEPSLHAAAQKEYLNHIPFVLKGSHTLELVLNDEGIRAAESGLSAVLDVGMRLAKGEMLKTDEP